MRASQKAILIISALIILVIVMRHIDIKRIPAYSSISQIGYSLAGISIETAAMLNGNAGAALLAYSGAFFHLFAMHGARASYFWQQEVLCTPLEGET